MKFDFSQPMTSYELLAIILAALALLIPLCKWIYDKYIKKLRFSFLPSGKISLFFNKSGAYIDLGGVYNATNKSAIVKNISAQVVRKTDKATLSLDWSTFQSPIYRKVAGNYESSFETAHPFKVEVDTLSPVFIEFEDGSKNMGEIIESVLEPIRKALNPVWNDPNIDLPKADRTIKQLQEFHNAKLKLNDHFFWKPSKYEITLVTEYENSILENTFTFVLSEDESSQLRSNIDSILVEPVATYFGTAAIFNTIRKEFSK